MQPEDIGLITEHLDTYNEKRKCVLTSSHLKTFRHNPSAYHDIKTGKAERTTTRPMELGTAIHCLMLDGEGEFKSKYAIAPEGMKLSEKAGLAWKKEHAGLLIMNSKEGVAIRGMEASLRAHGLAGEVFAHESIVTEATARGEYCGIECQARPDILLGPFLCDLKKCADLDKFEYDALYSYDYKSQLAFHKAVIGVCLPGLEIETVLLIAVEVKPPYRVGVWEIGIVDLEEKRYENEEAMERLAECIRIDTWPTGYEKKRYLGKKPSYKGPDFDTKPEMKGD